MKNKLLFNLLKPFATSNTEGKTFRNLIALVMMVVVMGVSWGQTNNYFGTSGTLSSNVWSTNSAGPFTSALVTTNGPILNFNNTGSATNATIATCVGINFGAVITWSAGGNIGAAGVNLPINVSSGINQDFGSSQSFSTSFTAALTKNGSGSLALTGGTFAGGFTLNAGTLVVRGVNSMGNGALILNGGTVCANSTKDLSGKFTSITFGGDVQFGEVTTNVPLAASASNITFSNNMALGSFNRTFTLGGSGTMTFGGIISNLGSNGLTFTANSNGTGKFAITNTANTYAGTTTITGGEAVFSGDLSLGTLPGSVTANSIIIDGGRLTLASAFTLDSKRGIQVGATAGTSINGGGGIYNGIIADKPSTTGFWAKQGSGLLILGGASTYSGGTFINNGTVQLGASSGSNRLPTSTLVTIGTSTKICVFDLNGNNQQIAGLVSAESTSNTVTSTGAATLTIGGSGSNTYGGTNAGTIGGAISLVMNGSGGTQTLSSANTYTGTTTVSGGTLRLNKSGGTTIPITNNVTIDGGTLQVSTNQTLNNLTLTSGTVIIDAGVTLTITGTITRTSGVIKGTDTSNLDITGTSGTIAFDQTTPGTTNVLKNLTISGSGTTTLGNALNITAGSSSGTVTVGTGATLVSAGFLTLKSDALGTASVGNSAGTISGEVTVERYIPFGKRAFRFLTPSVTTTSSIYTNWQIGGATTAGRGTHITGSTTVANGFDITASGSPSMYTYQNNVDVSTTGWLAISNTDVTTLTAGMGYRTLVRGDRNVDISVASTDNMNVATTLSATGTLKVGDVVFDGTTTPALNTTSNTLTNGYSLIGNPYASPVDWELVNRNLSVDDYYYAWDPNMGTLAERGRYVAYSASTHQATNTGTGNTNVSKYIQPGQAIFVKTIGASPSLTFEEADKASTFTNVFRTSSNSTLSVAVYNPSEVAFASPIDATIAVFGTDFDASVGLGDIEKLYSSGEHLAWSRGAKLLAMDATTPVVTNDELLLKTMQFSANKSYTFKVNATNFDTSLNGYLVDQYLSSQTQLDFSTSNFITFATTTDAASYGANRFKVVFNSSALNNEEWSSKSLRIYPNPVVDNQFSIAVSPSITDKVAITIYNMIGQSVYYESATAINNSIVVRPSAILKAGVYMVQMVNNGKTNTQKIIIK